MTPTPTVQEVQAFYDDRVEGKLRDFTDCNPRIEAAIKTIAEWAPPNPQRILEIGCGIGATTWRMAKAWPRAEVVGIDISTQSIEVAKTCFERKNLHYQTGIVEPGVFDMKFDLVILMDVYEHIAVGDRPAVQAAVADVLSADSRVIMTVPTPEFLDYGRNYLPSMLQPVDENIGLKEVQEFANATRTEVVNYRKVGIWHYGDYAHVVYGRYEVLADVSIRQPKLPRIQQFKNVVKKKIGRTTNSVSGKSHYLGNDILAIRSRQPNLNVTKPQRKTLAEKWLSKSE